MGRTVRPFARDAERLTTRQRLSTLMADRRVTSKGLAAKIRIQESTLANFRDGYRGIPSDVLAGMARELHTNVEFLLARSEDARPLAAILEEGRLREEARRDGVTEEGP